MVAELERWRFEDVIFCDDPVESEVSEPRSSAKGALLVPSSLCMAIPTESARSARPICPCTARHIIRPAKSEA